MYVLLAGVCAPVGALPIVAELQPLGVDESTLRVSSAEGGGLPIPQELAFALVDVVGEAAEA